MRDNPGAGADDQPADQLASSDIDPASKAIITLNVSAWLW